MKEHRRPPWPNSRGKETAPVLSASSFNGLQAVEQQADGFIELDLGPEAKIHTCMVQDR